MDDAELNAIRSARLAELQKNSGQSGSSSGSGAESQKDQVKTSMLAQILEPQARERLSRVRIVRSDRADAVEQYLIKLATTGSLQRKIGESELVEILDSLSRDEKKQTQSKIVFNRRTTVEDDEDDDFFD
ncbi:uncharacterized protein CLIB1423_11S02740 [[Candida] railenensis]|uniref:Programmed cell death protein 5 n=1 Tax=[Candida] railenensis TaxID=45579 RepID=A0A9P0QSH0_9ASCO|nr:uncharacterized protein CLIB1423_11S02740 [[Candida] railenensis]